MSELELYGATIVDRKEEKCTYTWTVNNLNFLSDEDYNLIDSPYFSISNTEWFIRLISTLDNHPYCFQMLLCKSSSNYTSKFQYSFSVRNEKTGKFIDSPALTNKSNPWNVERKQIYDDVSTLIGSAYSTLPNDTLKIICKVQFVTYSQSNFANMTADEDSKPVSTNISSDRHSGNIFFGDPFSDVKLVTACGKELKAHKVFLASKSEIFAAMFTHDVLENKSNIVNIPDVDHEILKEMLRYIYTGQVENMENVAIDLFIAADKYDIQDLKSMCEKHIANSLTVENAIQIFDLADKYNAEQLKNQAIYFVKSNSAKITETGIFKQKLQVLGSFSDIVESLIK